MVVGVEVPLCIINHEIATAAEEMVMVVVAVVMVVVAVVVVDMESALTTGATIHPNIAVVQPTTKEMKAMTWVVQWDHLLKEGATLNHHPKNKIIVTSSRKIGKYAIEEHAGALPSEVDEN